MAYNGRSGDNSTEVKKTLKLDDDEISIERTSDYIRKNLRIHYIDD
jgi:hypothetical protein